MNKYKAYKVDAENHTVHEVTITDDYKDLYGVLGLGCDVFTAPIVFEDGDTLMVDDEGLIRGPAICGFSLLAPDGSFWKFAGNGVLVGADGEGSTADVKMSLEKLKSMIDWMSYIEIQQYQEELGFL